MKTRRPNESDKPLTDRLPGNPGFSNYTHSFIASFSMNAKTLLTLIASTVALSSVIAGPAKAVDFGASWDSNCVGGQGAASCSLQNILNSMTTTGPHIDTTKDSGVQTFTNAGQGTAASYLFSIAGYAPNNTFGIYKLGDTSNRIELFGGATSGITQGAGTMVNFLADGSVKVGSNIVKNFGSQFGFYLDRKGPSPLTVYSQNSLNSNGAQQVVSYTGNGQTQLNIGGKNRVFSKDSVLLGFEDLPLNGSDRDYNDLAVLVSGVRSSTAVPEPTALLGLAAIGGAVAARRRKVA
jgi:hypothetical protein